MKNIRLHLSDIKDIKNIHWRHIVQSIIIFSCFCTLDTIITTNIIWLISASAIILAIIVLMIFANKIRIGNWSNSFNTVSAVLCAGCYFIQWLFPFALFFITLCAGIRFAYVRQTLNDYSTLFFIITSVFAGIILRFALILLPVWVLGILMLATVFNPVLERGDKPAKGIAVKNTDTIVGRTARITAIIGLALFFFCVEVFGGPLTDEISHSFPMQLVNIAYLVGYLIFIIAVLTFRVKFTSVIIMLLLVFGFCIFLIPPFKTIGIYFLLFLGGGIKVLMLSFPITIFKGRLKHLGAISGVFVYRLAFLLSGLVKTIAADIWHIESNLTYSLAAVNILLGAGLMFLLAYWDKQELKAEIANNLPKEVITVTKEVIREVTAPKTPLPKDLSEQERRVAEFILKGKSYRQIADDMNLSISTVGKYAERIFIKAGVDGQKLFIAHYLLSDTIN